MLDMSVNTRRRRVKLSHRKRLLLHGCSAFLKETTTHRKSPPLAPRERAVARGMQLAFGVAREAEGFEQRAGPAQQFLGDQLADADHLVAVVRVRDDEDVLAEAVEYGEGIRREAAEPARGLVVLVVPDLALEALLAEGERRAPHVGEVVVDHELG